VWSGPTSWTTVTGTFVRDGAVTAGDDRIALATGDGWRPDDPSRRRGAVRVAWERVDGGEGYDAAVWTPDGVGGEILLPDGTRAAVPTAGDPL